MSMLWSLPKLHPRISQLMSHLEFFEEPERFLEKFEMTHKFILAPADQSQFVFLCEIGMTGYDTDIVGYAASCFWFQLYIITVRAILFSFYVTHRQCVFWEGDFIFRSSIDEFNAEILWLQTVRAYPGVYFYS